MFESMAVRLGKKKIKH